MPELIDFHTHIRPPWWEGATNPSAAGLSPGSEDRVARMIDLDRMIEESRAAGISKRALSAGVEGVYGSNAEVPSSEVRRVNEFTAEAIAKRSIEEMRRVGSFTPQQATRWQQALQAALPDVKSGDRLLGIHQPGVGAVFKMAGRVVGEVPDAEFSRLFFGIWLSPQTSEPGLRQELLAATRTAGQP